jgi:sporulation protein YlmC with PRC-barrel domain
MMTRTLMAVAAVSGLMLSTALAQTPAPQPNANSSTSASPSTSATSAPGNAQAISTQSPDQWLASKFKGTDVIGADNSKIGDVSDILFDKQGKVDAVIIGVGGFIGIGQKDVALPLTAFQVVPPKSPGNDSSSEKLRLSMSKDQLQQMAEFKPMSSSTSTTTGSGSTSGTSTRTSPPASSAPTSPSNPNR